jgi:tryptophan-rich sensory protein
MAGLFGSIVTIPSVKTWYITLVKPSFNPPSWVFAPVWTTLFALIGIALYLVWKKKNNLFWFWVQLLLNILWSFLFFGLHLPLLALYEILILWFAIVMTMITFWSYNKKASLLLLPYLLWVTFATFLNFSIAQLN